MSQDCGWGVSKGMLPVTCGRGEGHRTTTCHMTVVGGKQGHAPCEMFLLQQIHFLCQFNFC